MPNITEEQKRRYLDAVGKKTPAAPPVNNLPQNWEDDSFKKTINQAVWSKNGNGEKESELDRLIRTNMLYTPTPIATLQPGVVSAAHLGWNQANEKGELPAGIDLRQLPTDQAEKIFSIMSPEDQKRYLDRWENLAGGNQ